MFASIGIILFPDVTDFASYTSAFQNLFEGSLGNFDTSIFHNISTRDPNVGYYYYNLFLLVNLVLLLNLLIAILSNTYSELQPKSKAFYYIEMAKLNKSKQ